ncbi:alpha/beta hydrolase [Lacticaseibacillus jixianensis]|uniref:Alpha/beta hydrolase n=1 Tax=Lacticaseibacillus jixianensis TaxID=2486012 RepID=A0ABW4B9D6_9LACO|nr:alpha/beta hydrolase [Lacticaseibacillus jixianensis]
MRNGMLTCAIALGLLLGIGFPAYQWMHTSVNRARVVHRSPLRPIFLVPGSSASQNRFNALVFALNRQTTGHSYVKLTVATDGTVKQSGRVAPRDNQPYIVVAFANNQDGYPNIKRQARWFDLAFTAMAKKYHFDRFSAIGHSNGGLVLTLFLEKYMNQADYSMQRLMTLGTPYNLEESQPQNRTQMLTDMVRLRQNLPPNLTVYSVAGSENYTSDGIVPLASVAAGKYVFQDQVAHYTMITLSGSNAQHSDLPQNQQTLDLIKHDLLLRNQRPLRQ